MVSLLCGFCFVLEIANMWEARWMEACAGLDQVSNGPCLSLSRDIVENQVKCRMFLNFNRLSYTKLVLGHTT